MGGTGPSMFMTSPWQLFLTWGAMVGIGAGAGSVGFAGAVRSTSGSYLLAFLASGLACLAASILVLRITRRG